MLVNVRVWWWNYRGSYETFNLMLLTSRDRSIYFQLIPSNATAATAATVVVVIIHISADVFSTTT